MLGTLLYYSVIFFVSSIVLCRLYAWMRRCRGGREYLVGFFHPWAASGGGGERVLWLAIAALHSTDQALRCMVYTGDDVRPAVILDKARRQFGVTLERPISFTYLKYRVLATAVRPSEV